MEISLVWVGMCDDRGKEAEGRGEERGLGDLVEFFSIDGGCDWSSSLTCACTCIT